MLLLLTLLASAGPTTDDVTALLTPRHVGDVFCDDVLALGTPAEVTQTLVHTAETVTMPPWVSTRAAHCVAALMPAEADAQRAALQWVTNPAFAGLALVVLHGVDALPEADAMVLARAAAVRGLSDPTFAAYIQPRLTRSAHTALRTLAD